MIRRGWPTQGEGSATGGTPVVRSAVGPYEAGDPRSSARVNGATFKKGSWVSPDLGNLSDVSGLGLDRPVGMSAV